MNYQTYLLLRMASRFLISVFAGITIFNIGDYLLHPAKYLTFEGPWYLWILISAVLLLPLAAIFQLIMRHIKRKLTPRWTIRTGLQEEVLSPQDFTSVLDEKISEVEEGKAEFLVLTPPHPINGITFLQIILEEKGTMHIEAGTHGNSTDLPRILCRDGLSGGEVMGILISFCVNGTVDTENWYELTPLKEESK